MVRSWAVDAAHNVKEGIKSDDGHVVLHTGLTCDLALGIEGEANIEHCVRDLVEDFVRVTFVQRLRQKKKKHVQPAAP